MMPTLEMTDASKTPTGPVVGVPDGCQILIICDDSNAEQLKNIFRQVGVASETTNSMTAGCEYARSGRFQAIVSKPSLGDGSWRRLLDIAKHYDLGFEAIEIADTKRCLRQVEPSGERDGIENKYSHGLVTEF